MIETDIPGYTGGTDPVPRSPVSLEELQLLQTTLLLGEDDWAALRRSGELLGPRVEEILDVWYSFVGANPHLLAAFTCPDGQPNQPYLAAVRRRSGRWIFDTARPSSIKPGSTTSMRSVSGRLGGARIAPTASKPLIISRCDTSSLCSSRSRPR